MGIHKKLEYV
jgi:uncharacterized protein YdcH (DUF465 family)